ncbi:MAG TPA: hypothetical protein VFV25_11625 [Methylibium sp.]
MSTTSAGLCGRRRGRGDGGRCATAQRLGASHAQRDLLELTLPAEHWRARVAR